MDDGRWTPRLRHRSFVERLPVNVEPAWQGLAAIGSADSRCGVGADGSGLSSMRGGRTVAAEAGRPGRVPSRRQHTGGVAPVQGTIRAEGGWCVEPVQRVVVVGSGLIGTSVALALRRHGVSVQVVDADPEVVNQAVDRGAGQVDAFSGGADVAVIGVPPSRVADVMAAAQSMNLARTYMDVASVKVKPLLEMQSLRCDMSSVVGTHPMAGREVSGPMSAEADLFEGKPWILCPTSVTSSRSLEVARRLVRLCGAVPVEMEPSVHDRAAALVSHLPQLMSSLTAAQLTSAPWTTLSLAGQGLRDVTRIASSDWRLWLEILRYNAVAIAEELRRVRRDVDGLVAALDVLGDSASATPNQREDATMVLVDLLRRGNQGRAAVPGKHGGRPDTYVDVDVEVPDEAGSLAKLLGAAAQAGVNIEDLRLEHQAGQPAGLVHLSIVQSSVPVLVQVLAAQGWAVPGAGGAAPD